MRDKIAIALVVVGMALLFIKLGCPKKKTVEPSDQKVSLSLKGPNLKLGGSLPKYHWTMNPGEYTAGFLDSAGLPWTITTDPAIAGTNNKGTQGIPTRLATIPSSKVMAGVASGLHDGAFWSLDSGRAFMYGLNGSCQLGNGTSTGTTSVVEILTDVNGNQFFGITEITSGWGPVSSVPFYAAIESDTSTGAWFWGNLTNVNGGSTCAKPTFIPFPGGKHAHHIIAYNSSTQATMTDGTVYAIGGTDDNAANTGVNSTPTTWTQLTIPNSTKIAYVVKGNGFGMAVSTGGDSVFAFGQLGWVPKGLSSPVFTVLTSPTLINSSISACLPVDTIVAAHTAWMAKKKDGTLWGAGSNEVGLLGIGPTINWNTYTVSPSPTGGTPQFWNWDTGMGEFVTGLTQVAKGKSNFMTVFGGCLYSFYFIAEDSLGNLFVAGRSKAAGSLTGIIPADTSGTRISAAWHISWDINYLTPVDILALISGGHSAQITANNPGYEAGLFTGTPGSFGTDAPNRPNTNLHANLVLTPNSNGFTWNGSTSTTDGAHKIMFPYCWVTQSSGTAINLGVRGGKSGTVLCPPGTYWITYTVLDNSWDTVTVTVSVTVSGVTNHHWYVDSTGGSDANSCAVGLACQTFAKAVSVASSGDTISFKAGERYPRTIYPISGIVINSYGTGSPPFISGSYTIPSSAWVSMGNGVYEALVPNDRATLNCVTLDGKLMGMGRYPDTGYVTYTSLTSSTLTSSAISGFPFTFAGATVAIRDEFYIIDTIHNNATGTNTLTLATSPTTTTGRGDGFFMMNHPSTLLTTTRLGSWYNNWSVDSLQMFFGVSGPTGHIVKIAMLDTLFYASSISNVTVQGVNFDYSNQYHVFENNTTNIFFDSCNFKYAGNNIVTANNAAHSTFRYDSMLYANNNWVAATGSTSLYPTFQFCYMDSAGMISGMGKPGSSTTYTGISWGFGFGTYTSNTFLNTGYHALYFSGDSVNVSFNLALFYCMVKADGGGFYTWDPSFQSYVYVRNVFNNIALFGGSANTGIVYDASDLSFSYYADGHSAKTNFTSNIGGYNGTASGINHGSNNTWYKNVWFGNPYAQFMMSEASGIALTGAVYKMNVHGFMPLTPYSLMFTTPLNDLSSFCSACDSNYFLTPIGISNSLYTKSSVDAGTNRTLSSWQTNLTIDLHSKLNQAAPLQLVYSVGGGSQFVYGYNVDPFGVRHDGTIALSAGSGTILQRLSLPTTGVLMGGKILFQ